MRHGKQQTTKNSGSGPTVAHMGALFKECGLPLTENQLSRMWIYHQLLRQHNAALNLTRVHNFRNMVIKLYVDSMLPATLLGTLPSPLLDLGTGAGMPGIPLKILRPETTLLLAEGRRRRTAFLALALEALQIEGVSIVERKIDSDFQVPVSGVITRAVESVCRTLERTRGCLERGGRVIFMKGPHCDAELREARECCHSVFTLELDQPYTIAGTRQDRRLLVFRRLDDPPSVRRSRAADRHPVRDIGSEQNEYFRELKKLSTARGIRKAGRALVAGVKPTLEILRHHPESCLAWVSAGDRRPPPEESPDRMEWYRLDPRLFEMLDVFGTRAPLLLIRVPEMRPWLPQEGFPAGCSLLVPFQDPENVGAVIRSAVAFGVRQVILLAESAHPFHPKALRASAGTVLSVALRQGPSLEALTEDSAVLALSAEGVDIGEAVFPGAFGLLAGLEGSGLPANLRRNALRIPMRSGVESLNGAAAAAVALYEWFRRTKRGVKTPAGAGTLDQEKAP